jgi:hypothetical protein
MAEELLASEEGICSMASLMYADRLQSEQPEFYPQFNKHTSDVRLSVMRASQLKWSYSKEPISIENSVFGARVKS